MVTLAALCQRIGGSKSSAQTATNARRAQLLLAVFFVVGFGVLSARVIVFGAFASDPISTAIAAPDVLAKNRPDIVDRNGRLLATDIRVLLARRNSKADRERR